LAHRNATNAIGKGRQTDSHSHGERNRQTQVSTGASLALTFNEKFHRIITMIKIRKNIPYIYFRQARIDMTLANGKKLGTYATLPYQDEAPTKEQWMDEVKNYNPTDITFRDFGIQSAKAPKGHTAWNLVPAIEKPLNHSS